MASAARRYVNDHSAIFVLLLIGAGAWLAWRLRDLIILLFLTLIVILAFRPVVDWLDRRGVNRRVGAFGVIIVLLAALIGAITYFSPQLVNQADSFIKNVPGYVETLSEQTRIDLPEPSEAFERYANSGVETVVNVTSATFSALFAVFAVLTIGYYGLAEYDNMWTQLKKLPGLAGRRGKAVQKNIEHRLGGWVRGQILLSVAVGLVELAVYTAFGLPFAALLALLGALLAVVPVIGPIAAAIPLFLVALTISPGKALAVVIAYLVIQLVVAYLLTPKILGKAAGLHPVSVIIALLAGGILGGVVGILLSIPVLVFLIAIYEGTTNRHAPLTD